MNHAAGLVLIGRDLPQLLDSDRVGLGVAPTVQAAAGDQLAAEVATRTLGEQRVARAQLHPGLEIRSRLTVASDPKVARGDPDHLALRARQDLGCCESGEYLDTEFLGLPPHPAHQAAEADHVVSVVAKALRQHPAR